jgi:uncharacterized protein with PIN domain
MDLLYGLALGIVVLIALAVRKRKKKKFLQNSVCPQCGAQMEDATTEEHLKKVRWNAKTYYGDFTVEHLAWECPNCGYRTEFEEEN